MRIPRCPRLEVDAATTALIRIADAWRRAGTPPRAGGYLDQPAHLAADCERIWAEQDRVAARMQGGE